MPKSFLASVAIVKDLGSQELDLFASFLISKKYRKGHRVFKQGSTRDKLVIIVSGNLAIKSDIYHGATIALFKAGDTLGEMAIIDKSSQHKYDTEVASDEAEVLELSVYSWHSIVKKNASIAHKLVLGISQDLNNRLGHSNNKLVSLISTSRIISRYKDLPTLAENLIATILQIIPCQKILLMTYSALTKKLRTVKQIGYPNIKTDVYHSVDADGLLKNLVTKPEVVFVDEQNKPTHYDKLPYACKHLLVVPIQSQQDVVGFIILGNKQNGRGFSDNNRMLLEAIGWQTAPIIQKIIRQNLDSESKKLHNVYIDPTVRY